MKNILYGKAYGRRQAALTRGATFRNSNKQAAQCLEVLKELMIGRSQMQ